MARTAAYFPDAAISLLPVETNVLNQHAHHFPQGSFQLLTVAFKAALAPIEVNAIEHLAEDIELLLPGCCIADAYGRRVTISAEMGQFLLRQIALATNPIHNLQVFAIGIGEPLQPVGKRFCLLNKAQDVESIERKGSVP